MSNVQKVIKYLAIAFGLFLSISIISVILFSVTSVFSIFDFIENDNHLSLVEEDGTNQAHFVEEFEAEQVRNLEIDVAISNLSVSVGETFKVEGIGVSHDFSCYLKDGKLVIHEDGFRLHRSSKRNQIIRLFIPKDFLFDKVTIETGISTTQLSNIAADRLEVEMGTGVLKADHIVANHTKIEGGIGKMEIKESELDNLEYEAGVGKSQIEAIIRGNSKIESGVGEVQLTILDQRSEYYFKTQNGIGGIYIEDKKVSDGIIGERTANYIELTGGIGKMTIEFKEEKTIES